MCNTGETGERRTYEASNALYTVHIMVANGIKMWKISRTLVYVYIRTQIVILSTHRNHICNISGRQYKNQDAALKSLTEEAAPREMVITLVERLIPVSLFTEPRRKFS